MSNNPLSQLASIGEQVIGKAAQNPTASKVLQSAMQLKDRVDDLSKRVRGLEAMERRIGQLEKRMARVESSTKKRATSSSKKKTAPKRTEH
jgi:transcription elongation GreA/GreB family factor